MCLGNWNVELLAPTVMSMESLGKSSQSIPIQYIASHDQRARSTEICDLQRIPTQ